MIKALHLSRRICVVAIVALGLSACDGKGTGWLEEVGFAWDGFLSLFNLPFVHSQIEGAPLPDATFDFKAVIEPQMGSLDCESLVHIFLHTEDWVGIDGSFLETEILEGPSCAEAAHASLRRSTQAIRFPTMWTTPTLYLVAMSEFRNPPIAYDRTMSDAEIDWALLVTDRYLEVEARWVLRCERPMFYEGVDDYHMRRALAEALDDTSFLIPEWDERRGECLSIGIALLAAFDDMTQDVEQAELASIARDLRGTVHMLTGFRRNDAVGREGMGPT